MKKTKQYIFGCGFLFLLLFPVLISCSDEEQVADDSLEITADQQAYLSVNAVANTVVSIEEEDKIHTIRVVAYKSGTYTSPLCNKFFVMKNAEISTGTFEIQPGKVDLYIIVNETSEMALDDDDITVAEVRERIFKITDLSDPISINGLPMYRECIDSESVVITRQHTKENPLKFETEVSRIMAKLTLKISNITHKDILLEKMEIKSLPSHSWLAPATYKGETEYKVSKPLKAATDRSSYDLVSVFIPEYIVADAEKRSYLYITGKSDKGFDCKYTISLGHGLQNYTSDGAVKEDIGSGLTAVDFNIVRNTHYEIFVNDIKGYENNKLTFLVGITSWDNIPENYFEGGIWIKQPISSRIPINGTTSFTAKFTHSDAPKIVYKWYRSQYKQTGDKLLPVKPTVEYLGEEEVINGQESTYRFESAATKPDISGDIFCMAAPVSATNFRESSHATLMVIGDWDGEGRAFPDMQDWKPSEGVEPGTSYLLLDDRETYGGKKIYRVKLMADGNWWMIQDLAYSENAPTELNNFLTQSVLGFGSAGGGGIGNTFWGACTKSGELTGGYLYTKEAAIGDRVGLSYIMNDSPKMENIIGLCPKGWHLPGNKNGKYNQEWTVFASSLSPKITVSTVCLFDYFNQNHFNAYTKTYVALSSDPTTPTLTVYKKEDSYRFHGGFVALTGTSMFSLGAKVGLDAEIILGQTTDDLFIPNDPMAGYTIFPNIYSIATLRCVANK